MDSLGGDSPDIILENEPPRFTALGHQPGMLIDVIRLSSTNLSKVSPASLPPPERDGDAVRCLFLHSTILGFRNYGEALRDLAADRSDIDAVFIDLELPGWMRMVGKQGMWTRGWDFHSYRHLLMWRNVMRRWFREGLPLDRFDVIHVMTQGNALALAEPGVPRGVALAVNIDGTAVQDVRDFGFPAVARRPFIRAEQRIFSAADLVVCRNGWAQGSVRDDYGIPPSRIAVAPNSVQIPERSRLDVTPHESSRPVRIAFIGRDWRRKGGPGLLRLHQRRFHERAELHVFTSRTKPLRRTRNVHWHGIVAHEDLMANHLPEMDLLVLPTHVDMMPWTVIEAAGAGLPVVTSRIAALPDVVIDGETGFLTTPGDWAGVEQAVARLIDDEPLRRRMGAAAREHVSRHFNSANVFPALLDRLVAMGRDRADRGQAGTSSVAPGNMPETP